ncbi:MAG: hypothetical protein EA364_13015 [Balneolaceae bacterium]|nr:MAG: hypothetical protein EA364_13015 [Balneolaceae bacterium]
MLFLMLVVIMYNDTRELIYEVPVDSIGLSAINRIDGDPETMIVASESTREGMYITELGTDLLPVSDFFIRKGRGPGEITFFGGFVVLSDTKVAALDLYLQKVIIYEKLNAAGWAVYKEWIPDPVLGMYPTLMIFHHSELYLIYRDHSGVNEALWVQVNGMDYETGNVRKVGRLIVHEDAAQVRSSAFTGILSGLMTGNSIELIYSITPYIWQINPEDGSYTKSEMDIPPPADALKRRLENSIRNRPSPNGPMKINHTFAPYYAAHYLDGEIILMHHTNHEDQRVLRCINRITGNVAEVFRPLEGDRVHAIRRHYVHIVSELDDGSQILKLYRFKDLC